MADKEKTSTEIRMHKDGDVALETHPDVTEEAISNELDWISIQLDGMYENLNEAMRPFQEEWDRGSLSALRNALQQGAAEGGGAWVEGMGDIFDGATWEAAGKWVSEMASSVADRAESYAQERYDEIKKKVEENIKKGNYFSFAWWSEQMTDTVRGELRKIDNMGKSLGKTATETKEAVAKAVKLWKHREAISNLPELVANGEVKAIENFVDTVLLEVDPELAKAIKNSKEFYAVLELINDPDAVLTYLAYVSLVFEAIPPNFYAYIGGKAGTYILCEVILIVIAALLTAGAALAARVTALGVRLAATSAKAAKLPKQMQGALKAIKAFELVIHRFVEVAGKLQDVGHMILRARQRGFKVKGSTKTTLTAKRQTTKRNRNCRICHSATHKTPARVKRGCVTYYTPKAAGIHKLATATGIAAAGGTLTKKEEEERRKAAEEDEREEAQARKVAEAEEKEKEDPPSEYELPETDDEDA